MNFKDDIKEQIGEVIKKNIIKKIFQAINDFFDPKYIDTTPIPKQENVPDYLTQKVKNTLRESGMFEHAKNYKNIPIAKTIPSMLKLVSDLIKDDEYLQQMLNNLKFLAEDEEYWINKKPYFNYLLFSSINQPFNSIVECMPQSLNFFTECIDFVEEKIKLKEIINSLNFINEEKEKIKEIAAKRPISELMEAHNWIFFEKVKKSSGGQFRMYFNDWTLKNSQIIEYAIKTIFKLFLQLDLAILGAKEQDIKELLKYNNTIGRLILYFDPDNELKHLARIRIYRNAVFHPGVEFVHDQKTNTKKLVFEDNYGKFDVDLEGFITDYKKLVIFVATCNYMVANILFKAEHEGQNIFQINYEYARKNGMKKFWVWQRNKRATNRYIKYFL